MVLGGFRELRCIVRARGAAMTGGGDAVHDQAEEQREGERSDDPGPGADPRNAGDAAAPPALVKLDRRMNSLAFHRGQFPRMTSARRCFLPLPSTSAMRAG